MYFSVLMSVYNKEKGEYLDKALESILINQSLIPNEVIIVKDGPLTDELDIIINKYYNLFSEIIKVIPLERNMGLGHALNVGLDNCKYDLVARMDTDDISESIRFEKQIKIFEENKNVDLVGGWIGEFFEDPNDVRFIRKVPLNYEDIKKAIKKRNPFNHVTVMFKKEAVLNSGSYQQLLYAEDYYLWVRLIGCGFVAMNIDDILVKVRAGEGMITRRSNPIFLRSWYVLQNYMLKHSIINILEYLRNITYVLTFMCVPKYVKNYIYSIFLRTKN